MLNDEVKYGNELLQSEIVFFNVAAFRAKKTEGSYLSTQCLIY